MCTLSFPVDLLLCQVTHDITDICKASVFSHVGKQTPVAVRFSTVGGESGSADTARYRDRRLVKCSKERRFA